MNLGQVFTPNKIVSKMLSLIQNKGKFLEPSSGDGAFLNHLPANAVGIEIDKQYVGQNVINQDFFAYSTTNKYDTIIGNPPYVQYKEIYPSTKSLLPNKFDKRTNLYIFFIDKCLDHLNEGGELIFIVPRDFIKTTSSMALNNRLMSEGSFTFWKELGDEQVFKNASPNTVIFRWEKNNYHNPLNFSIHNGLIFLTQIEGIKLSNIFTVHVGGASGANKIFIHEKGNIDLVVSTTRINNQTVKAFYYNGNIDKHGLQYLLPFKNYLQARKIKSFTHENWFEWGRKIPEINKPCIYVNTKTRHLEPFYLHHETKFDGSVLALVPINPEVNLEDWVNKLNNTDWDELGFKVGGRLIFGQHSLSNAIIKI
jgi:adenine-specific DNA-methyltransferase